jgi:hypothetical protein
MLDAHFLYQPEVLKQGHKIRYLQLHNFQHGAVDRCSVYKKKEEEEEEEEEKKKEEEEKKKEEEEEEEEEEKKKPPPWPQSDSELYRPSDRRLSAKLVPIFADRGCHVVSVTNPYGRILDFLD